MINVSSTPLGHYRLMELVTADFKDGVSGDLGFWLESENIRTNLRPMSERSTNK
jgi:hypothetical protein